MRTRHSDTMSMVLSRPSLIVPMRILHSFHGGRTNQMLQAIPLPPAIKSSVENSLSLLTGTSFHCYKVEDAC